MTPHVLNIYRSAYIELRQIGSLRHLLTAQATQTLVGVTFFPAWTTSTAYLLAVHSSTVSH